MLQETPLHLDLFLLVSVESNGLCLLLFSPLEPLLTSKLLSSQGPEVLHSHWTSAPGGGAA